MSIDGPGGIKNIRKNREFFQPMKRERILSPQNLELFATLQVDLSMQRGWSAERCVDDVLVHPSVDWQLLPALICAKYLC